MSPGFRALILWSTKQQQQQKRGDCLVCKDKLVTRCHLCEQLVTSGLSVNQVISPNKTLDLWFYPKLGFRAKTPLADQADVTLLPKMKKTMERK